MNNTNENLTKIGQKIKKIRELRNYTQEFMAKKLELSLNGYGKIEREETEITINRLVEIANILKTNVFDLLGFDENKILINQYSHDNSLTNGVGICLQQTIHQLADAERKLYEARITDLQQEITFLRGALDKVIPK